MRQHGSPPATKLGPLGVRERSDAPCQAAANARCSPAPGVAAREFKSLGEDALADYAAIERSPLPGRSLAETADFLRSLQDSLVRFQGWGVARDTVGYLQERRPPSDKCAPS